MIQCDQCSGTGLTPAMSSFGLPSRCLKCSGSGQISLQNLCLGNHACHFYTGKAHQMRTLTSFIAEGLRHGERCIWILDENTPEEATAALSGAGIRTQEELAGGALTIFTKDETYLKSGRFASECMLGQLQELIDETTLRGFRGLRATGELSWAYEKDLETWDKVPNYESSLDEYFLKEAPPFLALCQYDAQRVPAPELEKIRSAHRLTFQD